MVAAAAYANNAHASYGTSGDGSVHPVGDPAPSYDANPDDMLLISMGYVDYPGVCKCMVTLVV